MVDTGRNRKRRRPHHGHSENSSPMSSNEHFPTRQKTKATKFIRRGGRFSHTPPLFLLIALMLACYQKSHSSLPCVLATRLRERTKHRTDTLQEQHQRFLQNKGDPMAAPEIDYLDLPMPLWTSRREDSGDQFLEGNAIQVSPFDKNIIYATNRAGELRILSATNGKSIDTVRPAPRTLVIDGTISTWSLYSTSGMAFGSFPGKDAVEESAPANDKIENDEDEGYNAYLEFLLNNGIKQQTEEMEESNFAVYSVIDEAPSDSDVRFLPKTRVVCVSIPDHKILWTSAGLPGTPNGSPLVYYADQTTMNGNKKEDFISDVYVILTHNSVLIRPDNTTQTSGHLTVLDSLSGHVIWTQSEWSRDEVPKGYGPSQISHVPIMGGANSGGSFDNKNDVVVWTSSDQKGMGGKGIIYSFQMKSPSELKAEIKNKNSTVNGQQNNDPFDIRVLRKVRWNSIARPAMNRNGTNLFIAVTGNAIRGWNGIGSFNGTANWSKNLVPFANEQDDSLTQIYSKDVALSTAPVLSADEERLFAVSVKNETICLDAKTGDRMWTSKLQHASPLLSEPKPSPDNQRLYVIMSKDGKVHAINQNNGKALWTFGCSESRSGSKCTIPQVHADFDLSDDGTIFYYGDSDGRIVALTLGNRIKEEPSPTSTTITITDERGPLEFDKKNRPSSDTVQDNYQTNQNFGGKVAGILIAIILSLSISFISIFYVLRGKGIELQNYRLPRYRLSKDGGKKLHSRVVRIKRRTPNGPDTYEDRIISSLSEDEKSFDDEHFHTIWVDPTHSKPKHFAPDDDIPTADRLSVLLGTSNRIAPISDNFGFGQAVLI